MQDSKIKDVVAYLESLAPRAYQESYDNTGLLTGDQEQDLKGILITLDCMEPVVDEAVSLGCNLVVAHHPILFKGIKKLTGSSYVERTLIKAIRNDVAIYAAHTNLDNVSHGVNKVIGDKLGLTNMKVLSPRRGTLSKLVTFVPADHVDGVLRSLFDGGAGQVGKYKDCSFQVSGTGTFQPESDAKPFIGQPGKPERADELRIEVLLPTHLQGEILRALRASHPYEEVAYYLTLTENENQEVGAGMIGDLSKPEEPIQFLQRLKKQMNVKVVRHTSPSGKEIKRVAVCGGAGSFLLGSAIAQGADVFVSSDFKYHEFFDAEGKIMIADIGHHESEQFTKELFKEVLSKKFPTFAINFSKTDTNPISYL